ncbi:protein of unknown function [Clostridium beijerinckii]|nr:protein of unknown function [Clostridium beijerinckii]
MLNSINYYLYYTTFSYYLKLNFIYPQYPQFLSTNMCILFINIYHEVSQRKIIRRDFLQISLLIINYLHIY